MARLPWPSACRGSQRPNSRAAPTRDPSEPRWRQVRRIWKGSRGRVGARFRSWRYKDERHPAGCRLWVEVRGFYSTESKPRSMRRRIVDGNPCIAGALGQHVADARKRKMRASDKVAVMGSLGIGFLPLDSSGLGIGVELDGDRRTVELHRGDVHQVAPEHDLLALAFGDE